MASIKKKEIINCIEYIDKEKLFDKLNKVYSKVPSGDCEGCGSCCMESVGINILEFINIFNFLDKNKELKKKSLERIIDYYFLEYIKKSPCPFKDDNNRCLIYDVRPLNCRLFGHWKEKDYNKNLQKILYVNKEYKDFMKSKYEFAISEEVVNYKISYCEKFKPKNYYLSKSERLSFSEEIFCLDSRILSNSLINIGFKDRGIVEYFIEYLLYENVAYNIKINISKDKVNREKIIRKLKKVILTKV